MLHFSEVLDCVFSLWRYKFYSGAACSPIVPDQHPWYPPTHYPVVTTEETSMAPTAHAFKVHLNKLPNSGEKYIQLQPVQTVSLLPLLTWMRELVGRGFECMGGGCHSFNLQRRRGHLAFCNKVSVSSMVSEPFEERISETTCVNEAMKVKKILCYQYFWDYTVVVCIFLWEQFLVAAVISDPLDHVTPLCVLLHCIKLQREREREREQNNHCVGFSH